MADQLARMRGRGRDEVISIGGREAGEDSVYGLSKGRQVRVR
jgi:hypothetical protein